MDEEQRTKKRTFKKPRLTRCGRLGCITMASGEAGIQGQGRLDEDSNPLSFLAVTPRPGS